MVGAAGQKLSIISKSNIRYEGIMNKIDPIANTVSLEQVRMFGTEDRPVASFIAPSDNVYDYIVFKGSDIKDLTVFDAGKSAPPHDPAIVSAGKAMPSGSSGGGSRPGGGLGGMSMGGMGMGMSMGGMGMGMGMGGLNPRPLLHKTPSPSDYEQYNKQLPLYGKYGGGGSSAPYGKGASAGDYRGYSRQGQKGSIYDTFGKGSKGGGYHGYTRHAGQKGEKGYRSGKKGGKKGNVWATHTGMEYADAGPEKDVEFKDDFDFDSLQAKMQEERSADKDKEPEKGESKYKKDSSFFDSLTYDSGRAEKSAERNQQHQTDCETFGSKTVEEYELKNIKGGYRKGGKGKGGKKGFKGGKGRY